MTRLSPGDTAPDFTLLDTARRSVNLAELDGPVIVYFFPKAFTPGCTTEVCDFRDHQPVLGAAGFTVVGISPDDPERLAEFRTAQGLDHALLSDPDGGAARRWGAWGPKVINGQATEGLLRSTFVLDADHRVTRAEYEVDPQHHVAGLALRLGV